MTLQFLLNLGLLISRLDLRPNIINVVSSNARYRGYKERLGRISTGIANCLERGIMAELRSYDPCSLLGAILSQDRKIFLEQFGLAILFFATGFSILFYSIVSEIGESRQYFNIGSLIIGSIGIVPMKIANSSRNYARYAQEIKKLCGPPPPDRETQKFLERAVWAIFEKRMGT